MLPFGMTPDAVLRMERRSEFGTSRRLWFRIDRERAKDWSVDSVAKRILAISALLLLTAGSTPLLIGVHGQQPKTPLEWEVQALTERMDRAGVDKLPAAVALVVAHQQLEDERYQEQRDFQSRLLWGFMGTGGSMLLALFGWVLHQCGVILGFGETKPIIGRRRPI